MQPEIYADGIGEITVTGSIVRIDLVSLSATERDEKGQPKAAFRQRVVMPVDAFANSVELMQKALAGLVEAGAVRRVEPSAAPLEPAAIPAPAAFGRNASPNFN